MSEAQYNAVVYEPLGMTVKIGNELEMGGRIKLWPRAEGVKETGERKSPQRNMFPQVLQSRVQIPPLIH